MSQRTIGRSATDIWAVVLGGRKLLLPRFASPAEDLGRGVRSASGLSLLGERVTVRTAEVGGETGTLVSYQTRLGPLLGPLTFLLITAGCLGLGGGFIALGQIAMEPEAVRSVGWLAATRTRPLELVLAGILATSALAFLRWASSTTEVEFWRLVGFEPGRDRVKTSSLIPEGHPLLSKGFPTTVLFGVGIAVFFALQLPGIVMMALSALMLLEKSGLLLAEDVDLTRRRELTWRLGFRDGSYGFLVLLTHVLLLWGALLCGRVVDATYDSLRQSQQGDLRALRFGELWHQSAGGVRLSDGPQDSLRRTSIRDPTLLPELTSSSYGPAVMTVAAAGLRRGGWQHSSMNQAMLSLVAYLMLVPIAWPVVAFVWGSLRDAAEYSQRFGASSSAGEFLLAIEDRRGRPPGTRGFVTWHFLVWLAAVFLSSLALLVGTSVLAHAILGRDIPGLERAWIPYSLLREVTARAGLQGWFDALLILLFAPLFLCPIVTSAVWLAQKHRIRSAAESAIRADSAWTVEVAGVKLPLLPGPTWLASPQLGWRGGPFVLVPRRVLSTLKSESTNESGPLAALGAHELIHIARIPRHTFLSWLSAFSIGLPGYFRLLEDTISEELRADALAIEVAGKAALKRAHSVARRRALRAGGFWYRIGRQFPEALRALRFHFAQGVLGYIHPTPETRSGAFEQRVCEATVSSWPAVPSGLRVRLSTALGAASGLLVRAAALLGSYALVAS